jgi:uncharacterized protein (DUF1330 family)
MEVVNEVMPSMDKAMAFFNEKEDGPFTMINLLRFKEFAEYEDGRDPELSGREAYLRYGIEVIKLVSSLGGKLHFSGDVTGILVGEVEDLWDAVALVEYPSLKAFQDMALSQEMHEIEVHRVAGLAGQLNIRSKSQF